MKPSCASHSHRASKVLFAFLVAMQVATAAFSLGTPSSASADIGTETRVRVSGEPAAVLVGPPEHISAGQRLGESDSRVEYVVATGVAANSGRVMANACRTNSFTGSTLVLMADGSKKPIKDVKLGDRVIATDPETGETGPRKVVDLIRHGGLHTMVAVRLADGSTIDATDHHPFWVESRSAWVDAIDLRAGDIVITADGDRLGVAGLGISEQDLTAYNLTIDDIHTYYVGDDAVLVHNVGCDEWASAFFKRNGGEMKTFESPLGRRDGFLGPYRPGGPGTKAVDENWGHHTVVVRDGQVFDQWHPNGVGIDDFKQMFDYNDVIGSGF